MDRWKENIAKLCFVEILEKIMDPLKKFLSC